MIFFQAQVAQSRIITDLQLDTAALELTLPERLAAVREAAMAAAFDETEGRPELGHFVELKEGEHKGKRGVVMEDDKSGNPYKVSFADGTRTYWLRPTELKTSGKMGEMAFLVHALQQRPNELQELCVAMPAEMRDALASVRERVGQDKLPLLSLLTADPLQVQSSHLSFQEYYAARQICEEGTVLPDTPPWQWPAAWANTLTIGAEMGAAFSVGLKRAAGVHGDALDLGGKLGGDRVTALKAVGVLAQALRSLK